MGKQIYMQEISPELEKLFEKDQILQRIEINIDGSNYMILKKLSSTREPFGIIDNKL